MSFIIGVAGGSCSGKTTLSRHLQHRIGGEHCLLVRQDDYYHDIRTRDHPSEPIAPRPYIIVEGILLLNSEQVRPVLDYSLYMKCSTEVRFARRLARDIAERGRTEESVHEQFHKDVEPAHQAFVSTSAVHADKVVPQDDYINDLTGLVDSVLKRLPPIEAATKIAQA